MEIVTPCMVAFAMLISSIIFITVQIPCVQHFLDWNPAFSLEGLDLWHIIRRTSPVAVGAICLQVIAWSPLIFLGFLGKAEDLAIFGLSSQFMFAYLNLLALIYRLIFPVICEASRTGDAKCFKQVEYLSPKILLFFLAASGLACLMAPVVLNFLRKEYLGVLPLMRAMFVFSSIIIWGEIFCVTLLAQNRMQEYIIPIVAGVLAVVLVNLWAIPLWGEWGAFLAFVIAELTVITGSLLFFMANRNSMLQDQGPLNDSGLDRGWKEVLWKRIR